VIDGSGRWLMPGLMDMHIHVVGGEGDEGDGAWQQMQLLVANGVTTARSLAGAPTAPVVKRRVDDGSLLGPRLYLAGPSLNRNSVPTPEAGRAAVLAQAAQGFRFLKTHGVDSATYEAVVAAAAETGVPLVGHVVPDYGLRRALAAGQQVEHLDGYLAALLPEGAEQPAGQFFFGPELEAMDEGRIPEVVRATLDAGVWNSPTMALFDIVGLGRGAAEYQAWPEAVYAPANAKAAWARTLDEMAAAPATPAQRARYLDLRRGVLNALVAAGAPLLVGSDSPQLFMLPGFALHRELEALVAAGLSPYRALSAATRDAGRYLGLEAGTVTEGMLADLVLLDGNPLEDVAHAGRIRGVVLRGRWLSDDELDALEASVRAAVQAP
jgi:imidazolonepropionase-like amidohydrolase